MRILISLLLTSFAFITLYVLIGNTREHSSYKNADQESPSVTYNILSLHVNDSSPIELGNVNWLRNFDEAVKEAKVRNKPLLVFFQEVPGCSTSSGYGKNVISHPLIVEAIESLFVPVAIYNNRDGHDYQILKSFGEPSWNNPVVRIMTSDRKELVPRLSGDYSKLGLVTSMINALRNNNQTVPNYLRLLNEELQASVTGTHKAVLAMSCFWSGEETLGGIDGVISTNPGFMKGYEVVEVEYDPNLISYNDLVNKARHDQVADHVFVKDGNQKNVAEKVVGKSSVSDIGDFRPDSDPKHYLSQTIYKYVPMTSLQASRVNVAIGSGGSPDDYLSPRQLELLNYIKSHPEIIWQNTVGLDFPTAWNSAMTLVKR
jgi:hypothetical protein